jgi:hypothetical protein
MSRILFVLFGFIYSSAIGQVYPFQDLFFWSQEDLLKNKISQIDGYEFEASPDSLKRIKDYTTGEHQTEETFDSLGRIRSKTNFYLYSDIGSKKRELNYNLHDQVVFYANYEKDSLKREEHYIWSDSELENWTVKVIEEGEEINFSKETQCNNHGLEIQEILKIGKKIMRLDTIIYLETDAYKIKVRRDKIKNKQIDSLIVFKTKGDTLFKQEIYESNLLVYKEIHWTDNEHLTERIETYEEGLFHKVYYRVSNEGRVFFEKQIHVVPNLNFDKLYYYSLEGIPLKKEIYRNQDTPDSVIYYSVKKR